MSLSNRLRPGCEAAAWVIDEVRALEAEIDRLRAERAAAEIAASHARASLAEAERERDGLRARLAEVIEFGAQCATGISGDPDDGASVLDINTATLAIRENVRLGCEAHSLLAELRARLAAAERERDENEGVIAVWRRRCNEAERDVDTLLSMIRHQRDVLRECLPYLNESMAGKRPGRSADDIRAAVKALTANAALERKP